MMLIWCSGKLLSIPFQKQVVAADVIVMPRSRSCSIQSMTVAPSWTFAYLVRDAGVEKDAFGGRGLAGINVRTDADVAIPTDWGGACHDVWVRSFVGCLAIDGYGADSGKDRVRRDPEQGRAHEI
jgi:hypothetical protein